MWKRILYGVLALGLGWSWLAYALKNSEMKTIQNKIVAINEAGENDPEELLPKLESDLHSLEGEKTFNGVLLTFLSAGLVGIFGVAYFIPWVAERFSSSVYDSGEVAEKDVSHDARSFVAQGKYAEAIAAYRVAATAEPLNRLPWVEIAKIQKDHLDDPNAAVATIHEALENQKWQANDEAYFLFRLAELFEEVQGDRASAVKILHQITAQFPETRHSANAHHKLHELNVGVEPSSLAMKSKDLATEEAEYLAKMRKENS